MFFVGKQLAALVFAVSISAGFVHGQNLLSNGSFEPTGPPQGKIPGWSLAESVTGSPGLAITTAVQNGFSNQPGSMDDEFGIFLQPWAGNNGAFAGQNRMVNAILSQTVDSAVVGNMYTFTGWSNFEQNYSGGVETLDILSPSGEVESPTETIWELAFLDSNGAVIGMPETLDLRTEQVIDRTWRQHMLIDTAPMGTEKVRVTASMINGVFNVNPEQSAFIDNFSLKRSGDMATELLTNADINTQPTPVPEFVDWMVTELPEGANTLSQESFAQNRMSTGTTGVWVRGFVEGDGILSQTVGGTAGGNYTFSGWSAFEQHYTGGLPGTTTDTFMELAFLDGEGEELETPERINLLAEGQMNDSDAFGLEDEDWRQFSVSGMAPTGTVSVRVSAGAIGMVPGTMSPQSAFFDDFALTLATAPGVAGDYNGNGVVDAADYTYWRDRLGQSVVLPNTNPADMDGMVTQDEYNFWVSRFGATSGSASLGQGVGSVPEPTAWGLAMLSLLAGGMFRRRVAVL
jgi:hypothetical protein